MIISIVIFARIMDKEHKPSGLGKILKYSTLSVALLAGGFFAGTAYNNEFTKKYMKDMNNDDKLDYVEKSPLGINIYIQQPSGYLKSLDAINEDELEAYKARLEKKKDSLEQKITYMR